MQKQTQNSIDGLQSQINRIERILLISAGALFSGMAGIILSAFTKTLNPIFKSITSYFTSNVHFTF
jgi:hypothetical protein